MNFYPVSDETLTLDANGIRDDLGLFIISGVKPTVTNYKMRMIWLVEYVPLGPMAWAVSLGRPMVPYDSI